MTLSLPAPDPNADSRMYWQAASERRLALRRCCDCGKCHFMPRGQCPSCWSDQLEWVDGTGLGSVYSFAIVHRAPTPDFAGITPYVIALIDLEEGPRMFANIVGPTALEVSIGDRVNVTFEARGTEGALMPQFIRMVTAS